MHSPTFSHHIYHPAIFVIVLITLLSRIFGSHYNISDIFAPEMPLVVVRAEPGSKQRPWKRDCGRSNQPPRHALQKAYNSAGCQLLSVRNKNKTCVTAVVAEWRAFLEYWGGLQEKLPSSTSLVSRGLRSGSGTITSASLLHYLIVKHPSTCCARVLHFFDTLHLGHPLFV